MQLTITQTQISLVFVLLLTGSGCTSNDCKQLNHNSILVQNPIIHADYSDPDVVRVGEDYYLTASSFNCVPGLPILHSRDLVNWTGKEVYYNLSQSFAEMRVNQDGMIYGYDPNVYNIDYISPGNILFYVYDKTKDERYKKALDLVRSQLDGHPNSWGRRRPCLI